MGTCVIYVTVVFGTSSVTKPSHCSLNIRHARDHLMLPWMIYKKNSQGVLLHLTLHHHKAEIYLKQ